MGGQSGVDLKEEQVSAVIVPCTSRKRRPAGTRLRADDLQRGSQRQIESDWLARLKSSEPEAEAAALYMGRGFALGSAAASQARAPLFVISAGLGLLSGTRHVPGYTITVGMRGPDSIRARVEGRFDPARWWRAVSTGPFSCDLSDALVGKGRVLVALSQSYAELLADTLAALPSPQRSRLRLFGANLAGVLPIQLAPQVMPYDARLDAITPGTRTDFAQRALSHFASIAGNARDTSLDAAAVEEMLARHSAPVRMKRPRLGDEAVVLAIRRHLRSASGIGRILRRLREDDGIACEQKRFTRLYHVAVAREAAA